MEIIETGAIVRRTSIYRNVNPEQRWIEALWSRSHRRSCDGFDIGFATAEQMELLLPKIQSALKLMRRYDTAYAAVRASMPRILVRSIPGYIARFWDASSMCELHDNYLAHPSITAEKLALTLVHEGCHARVHLRGLRARGLSYEREERLAARAEVAFAKRLPDAADLVELAMKRLGNVEHAYSAKERARRRYLDAINLGVPRWFVRLVARWRRVDLDRRGPVDPFLNNGDVGRANAWQSRYLVWISYAAWMGVCLVAAGSLPAGAHGWIVLVLITGLTAIRMLAGQRRS